MALFNIPHWWVILFLFMLCMMVIDYFTGWIAAIKNKEWKSSKARDGVAHKIGAIVVCVVCAGLDVILVYALATIPEIPVVWPSVMFPVVCLWYVLAEVGSILENVALMGAPIPGWIVNILDVGKKILEQKNERKDE